MKQRSLVNTGEISYYIAFMKEVGLEVAGSNTVAYGCHTVVRSS